MLSAAILTSGIVAPALANLPVEVAGKASPSKQIDHAGIANDDLDRDGGRVKSEMPEYPADDGREAFE